MNENSTNENHAGRDVSVLIGTGGSRSILFGTGVLLALAQSRFGRFRSIGGVSGGSMPASMIASRPDVTWLLNTVLDTDFNKMVKRRVSLVKFLYTVLRDPQPIDPPPLQGALDAADMGQYFNDLIPDWPPHFWTMALSGQKKVIFTRDGILMDREGGGLELASAAPVGVGTAVCATCAVPMLLDPVPWKTDNGDDHLLIDGGFGPEGRCPVSVPEALHALKGSYLIVVNVGPDKSSLHLLIDRVFGIVCDDRHSLREDVEVAEDHSRIVVTPASPLYGSFKFKMTRREKWQMIMSGYMAAVTAFARHGLLSGDNLAQAQERGVKALLLLAARQKPYNQDKLPPELDQIFVDLSFPAEKFAAVERFAADAPVAVAESCQESVPVVEAGRETATEEVVVDLPPVTAETPAA
ncbi:MAG: patatin-like phospholipase family protein [Candidatus Obscuribacter sp.]|nr:patatin-like phospholipase family protein [Candidatus Obscuribacter sp.]